MSLLHDALESHFRSDEEAEALEHPVRRLNYSTDLDPDACDRQIVLSLQDAPRKPLTLPERLMFEAGHRVEAMVVEALKKRGAILVTQALVRPMRPSAWAWSGRLDVIVKDETGTRVLVEIKTARSHAFKTKRGPLKDAHRWQASAYFHEAVFLYQVERAELWYLDRDGANDPVVYELREANGLLVPIDLIVSEEEKKNALVKATALPLVKKETLEGWRCNYCAFRGVSCNPEQALWQQQQGNTVEPARTPAASMEVPAGAVAEPPASHVDPTPTPAYGSPQVKAEPVALPKKPRAPRQSKQSAPGASEATGSGAEHPTVTAPAASPTGAAPVCKTCGRDVTEQDSLCVICAAASLVEPGKAMPW